MLCPHEPCPHEPTPEVSLKDGWPSNAALRAYKCCVPESPKSPVSPQEQKCCVPMSRVGAEMLCPHEPCVPKSRILQDRQCFAIVVFCPHGRHVDRSGKGAANCKTGPDAAGAEMLCPREPTTTYKCCVPMSVTPEPHAPLNSFRRVFA